MLLILSYNVAGWQSTLRQIEEQYGDLRAWLTRHGVDVLALQEAKVPAQRLRDSPKRAGAQVEGYDTFWACCQGSAGPKGVAAGAYSGVATFARVGTVAAADPAPLGCPELDREGRCLLTDHGLFVLLNVYAPASGEAQERLPYKLRFLRRLGEKVADLRRSGRRVIVAGDLNVARRPQDVFWRDRVVELHSLWRHPGLPGSLALKLRDARPRVEQVIATLRVEPVPGKNSRRQPAGAGQPRQSGSWRAAVSSSSEDGGVVQVGKRFGSEAEARMRTGMRRVDVGEGEDAVEAWGEGWVSVSHLEDVLRAAGCPLAESEAMQLSDVLGGSYSAPATRAWFDELLEQGGMVDTFAALRGRARERFTAWDQYTNARYTNNGVRIDYVLVDSALMAAVKLGGRLASQAGEDPDSAAAALSAATADGRWKPAPFDGTGMAEAPPSTYASQFQEPHTGIVYLPPKYSDHVAASAVLDLELPGYQKLSTDRRTSVAQPHRTWRGIQAYLRPMGACKAPEAALQGPTPTAAATSQSSEDPNCRLGYEQRIVRESSVPEASEAKVKLEPSLREGLDDKEQQQAPPPALQMEGLGSSYRDAAAASGKNYRDFAAATRNHRGGSLADYWRQRRWAPEQLQPAAACSREVAETPGQRVQPSRHAETSAAKAEASPDQSRSLSREDGPSDHDGCLLLRDRQDFGDLFILDITEHNSPLGLFLLHTLTETGGRVVVHCHDYCYPLHIAAPVVLPGPSLSEDLQDHGDTLCLSPPSGWIASAIGDALARLLGLPAPGTRLAKTSRTARSSSNRSGTDPGADLNAQELSVEIVERIPLVYYRPTGQKSGSHSFLRVRFPSSLIPVKRAAEALRQLLATGCLAHVPPGTPGMGLGVGVRTARLHWEDNTVYEDDLKIKSHFLHDCRLSAGSWVSLSDASQVPRHHWRHHGSSGELTCSWRNIQSRTPDAATLAIPARAGSGERNIWREDQGIAPLRVVTVECIQVSRLQDGAAASPSPSDPIASIGCTVCGDWCRDARGIGSAVAGSSQQALSQTTVFVWRGSRRSRARVPGTHIAEHDSEADMLQSWRSWLVDVIDPHVMVIYAMQDSLAVLVERFRLLGLGDLALGCGSKSPVKVESVVMYSAEWVRSKTTMGGRMASTSNQETFKAEVEGRLVLDLQRVVLSSHLLPTYGLAEAVNGLLGRPLECIPPTAVAELWNKGGDGGASRLCSYVSMRSEVLRVLLLNLNALEETVEMARAAGLTFLQVLYNGQIVRVYSLIHRACRLLGFVIPRHTDASNMTESPYLIHPVDTGNAGLYEAPVVVLDFASLYPSLFSSYNLCYSSMVHPSDVGSLPKSQVFHAPNGAVFVKDTVRRGVLPQLLAGLVAARSKVRAALKAEGPGSLQARVMDGRQKALKLMANAMYGFTGAQPSPVRLVALADACLSLGAAVCHRARQTLEDPNSAAALGRHLGIGKHVGLRVIYAQTDSLFVELKGLAVGEAGLAGHLLASLAVSKLAEGLRMNFERVLCPFLLLHVNRYAGRAFAPDDFAGSAKDGAGGVADTEALGKLLIKGVKSEWRLTPHVVRRALKGLLEALLMRKPGRQGAELAAAEALRLSCTAVRELLCGEVGVHDLAMTGGLWRVTGAAIDAAATASASSGELPPDIHGPHAHLAIRLRQRDPGRRFVLGERIPYVLLAGCRNQEQAAEDPVVAVLEGQPLDLGVYCANKLSPALREILEHTLSPSQLREFDTGDHRRVRAPFSRWVAPMRPPAARGSASLGWPTRPSGSPPGMSDGQDDWECRRCTLLNARPRRSCEVCGAPRGSGGKNDPKRQKHGAVKAPGGTVPKHQQLGLRQFAVVSAAQCIGCRAVLGSGGGSSEERGALCIGCSPRAAEIYLDKLRRHQEAEGRVASALAACGHCQSSGPGAEVLCANASCPKLYDRLEAVRQLHGSHAQLNLEW